MIFVARKMNIPTTSPVVSETVSEEKRMVSPVNSDELSQQFAELQRRTQRFLIYSSSMSADDLESSVSEPGEKKFDTMLGILDVLGKAIATCDALSQKLDQNRDKTLHEAIYAYSVKLEQNLNILISYFASLSRDKKLSWLGIDEETITMEEIAQQKLKVSNLKYFPQKERGNLNEAIDSLAVQLDSSYERVMENSIGSLFFNAAIVIAIIYGVTSAIAYFLWDWLQYAILFAYLWFVIKKVEQFQSIAKSRGEEGDTIKIILASLGNASD